MNYKLLGYIGLLTLLVLVWFYGLISMMYLYGLIRTHYSIPIGLLSFIVTGPIFVVGSYATITPVIGKVMDLQEKDTNKEINSDIHRRPYRF